MCVCMCVYVCVCVYVCIYIGGPSCLEHNTVKHFNIS